MAKCTEGCGRTTKSINGLCEPCEDYGMWENAHSDEGHELAEVQTEDNGCPVCHPELDPRNTSKKKVDQKNSSVAGYTRRPQLNHLGHSHPQTPAARRACKNAFWASLTPVANTSTNPQVAEAMVKWNHACDSEGKPVAPKPAKLYVAPLGPKGGVSASVKAAGAKVKEAK